MALACALTDYRDELEADFQQYYGLDLERAGQFYSFNHAARLMVQLPENSRVKRAARGDEPWQDEVLLASIANSLRALPVQLAGKKSDLKKVHQFGPKAKDSGTANSRKVQGVAVSVADFDRMMNSTEWKAVNGYGEH